MTASTWDLAAPPHWPGCCAPRCPTPTRSTGAGSSPAALRAATPSRPAEHVVVAGVLSLAAALLAPATPPADNCGDPTTARPARDRVPGRPPLIVGDSVLLGAVDHVAGAGYEVNTRGCRQMSEGLRLLAAKGGRLPSFVVIMLGANGEMEPGQIR